MVTNFITNDLRIRRPKSGQCLEERDLSSSALSVILEFSSKYHYTYRMVTTISINLPKEKKKRLERLALSYGLSLSELSQQVLENLAAKFPIESIEEYKHSKQLISSYNRALRDWKKGNIRTKL